MSWRVSTSSAGTMSVVRRLKGFLTARARLGRRGSTIAARFSRSPPHDHASLPLVRWGRSRRDTRHVTPGTGDPPERRLAVGLIPATEGEFVAFVELARPLLTDESPAMVVVPALDEHRTTARVEALVGDCPHLTVEPAHEYLRRGHDNTALVADDPVERGRSLVKALHWLRSPPDGPAGGRGDRRDGAPDPSEVVAWLGLAFVAAPRAAAPAVAGPIPVVPLGDGRLLVRTAWGGTLVAFAADRSLTPDLALDGVYDPAFVRFLERELREGDTVVDVGANVGLFSVRMAQLVGPTGSVLALEADPEIHAVLQENLDLNYVSGWARALAVAAYSSQSTLTFQRTRRFRGNGALEGMGTSVGDGYATESYETMTVEALPLDSLLGDANRVRLVKIDVEGAERHALEGMSGLIAEGRVETVAIEFVKAVLGREWEALCRHLARLRDCHDALFATLAADGSSVARSLDDAMAVGAFPQLLIEFPGPRRA